MMIMMSNSSENSSTTSWNVNKDYSKGGSSSDSNDLNMPGGRMSETKETNSYKEEMLMIMSGSSSNSIESLSSTSWSQSESYYIKGTSSSSDSNSDSDNLIIYGRKEGKSVRFGAGCICAPSCRFCFRQTRSGKHYGSSCPCTIRFYRKGSRANSTPFVHVIVNSSGIPRKMVPCPCNVVADPKVASPEVPPPSILRNSDNMLSPISFHFKRMNKRNMKLRNKDMKRRFRE
ncbi:hypothetical protein Pmani_037514 [Petrolisthes manimaculis]|uniref:Uncharacterized protein n=1 Tax=Petrolisthes manimaculis TaxID=1843537 RepID=A0AAE1TL26_9EUCA|nr:hypothetical protein Pmani_037514 [Petrolisthes manimaculis]